VLLCVSEPAAVIDQDFFSGSDGARESDEGLARTAILTKVFVPDQFSVRRVAAVVRARGKLVRDGGTIEVWCFH
jgi:hypothetical protein|tara:strand:+ start:498 stop:719 length:222 start_codon:yes stop_codon:yes gene_type:complete